MSGAPGSAEGAAGPAPAARPCGSCPYRRDVPSGLWAPEEYAKLPEYDRPTMEQSPALFLCHQQDGHLCAGWLACHDKRHLLALRLQRVDPSAYDYESLVPVFGSGAEAAAHGMAGVTAPDARARRAIAGLEKKAARRGPLPLRADRPRAGSGDSRG